MFKRGTKIYSVLNGKCPRCHEGDFFKYTFTFNPSKITQLHDNCPKCNLRYMMEPSFFYGAMYVNYGITVALSIVTFLISSLVFEAMLLQSFAAIIVTLLLLTPLNLRLSRIIWINMFVNYETNE
ncbi:MAG: hypothetical protein ACI9Z4_001158 [Polaribacter sp.]|jgi:uncharacterized protein (DUF983 family)